MGATGGPDRATVDHRTGVRLAGNARGSKEPVAVVVDPLLIQLTLDQEGG